MLHFVMNAHTYNMYNISFVIPSTLPAGHMTCILIMDIHYGHNTCIYIIDIHYGCLKYIVTSWLYVIDVFVGALWYFLSNCLALYGNRAFWMLYRFV